MVRSNHKTERDGEKALQQMASRPCDSSGADPGPIEAATPDDSAVGRLRMKLWVGHLKGNENTVRAIERILSAADAGEYAYQEAAETALRELVLRGWTPQQVVDTSLADIAALLDKPAGGALPGIEEKQAKTAPAPYVFREYGEYFEICFGVEHGKIKSRAGGWDYLRLLKEPGKAISCSELAEKIVSVNDIAVSRQDTNRRIAQLKCDLRDYSKVLESASDAERPAIERERDGILKELSNLKFRGKPRPSNAPGRSAVVNRTKDFRNACNCKGLPHFAAFLEDHVKIGTECKYSPPAPPLDWQF